MLPIAISLLTLATPPGSGERLSPTAPAISPLSTSGSSPTQPPASDATGTGAAPPSSAPSTAAPTPPTPPIPPTQPTTTAGDGEAHTTTTPPAQTGAAASAPASAGATTTASTTVTSQGPAESSSPAAPSANAAPGRTGASCSEAAASTRVRVMVPDVESSPRFVDAKGALGQVLASEARTGDTVDVIAAADVRALLDQEANKQLVGCDDTGCLAEIADALDADLIVAGRIGETPEGVPLVALTLINARAVLVVNRVQMAWPGDPTRLGDVVQAAARVLLLEPSRRPPGGVELRGLPDGARVAVDDATVDAAALARLPIGPHEVRVQADGRAPFSTWVLVQSGTNVAVDVVLEEAGVPPIVWLAGAAGAAVVGAAGTIGVFLATSRVDTTITTKFPGIAIGTPPSKVTP